MVLSMQSFKEYTFKISAPIIVNTELTDE